MVTTNSPSITAPSRFYVEYRSGNCSVIQCSTLAVAREEAADFARSFNTRVTLVREATADDLANFPGRIYEVSR